MITIDRCRASARLAGRRPGTVLIIEADTAIRGQVAELLIGEGYAVAKAADSREGLRCAQQLKPDLILLDPGLPLTLGLDELEKLRSNQEIRHIPVVVVNGHRDLLRREVNGAAGLNEKPFDLANLLDHVERLVRRT
jgi:DNA-binding response OmpR family regulator